MPHNYKILLFSFCFILLLFGCKKNNIPHDAFVNGQTSAILNGDVWESDLRGQKAYGKLEFTADKYMSQSNFSNMPYEGMSIIYFDMTLLKKQRITQRDTFHNPANFEFPFGSFGTTHLDGDVVCDIYEVIESDSLNNWVRIDGQRDNFNEAWGSYSMHLYRVRSCTSSVHPDTLLITNGQFYFKLD